MRSADCQESMMLSLFFKANGSSFIGQCFVWWSMMLQVFLGVLAGMGSYLAVNGWAGRLQVLVIAVFKLSWAALLLILMPCSCKITNAVRTSCSCLIAPHLTMTAGPSTLWAGDCGSICHGKHPKLDAAFFVCR